jgi:hypothetical protein
MTSNDLEKELRQNLKLRRELQGEIAKAETAELHAGYGYAIGS